MIEQRGIDELRDELRGPVIAPGGEDYDEARKLYNGMIDKRPGAIVRCVDVADVMTAVGFARKNGVLVAIRGGGHNGPGLGSCDDGLMIDTSLMKGIEVNPVERTVRAQPGCTQGDLDHATHAFGLAVPAGIISTTGIAGLTLGGGTGYLSRKFGLTIDSLIGADVVLADGSFVTANAETNSDLLWALRGGGGNFGVVTSFVYRAHPVSSVYAGPIFWDAAHTKEVMTWYRDFIPTAPRDLCTFLGLKTVPSSAPVPEEHWGKPICILMSCYNGNQEDGEAALQRVRAELPTPMMDWMGQMPYPAVQSMFDPLYPKGFQWYWKGDFVNELTDDAIDVHVAEAAKIPTELCLMHLYPIDGAVHEKSGAGSAWSYRDAQWSMVIAGIDPDPANASAITKWAKDYWAAIHPFNPGGAYVNFMMDDEGQSRIEASYGANYPRLKEIKRKYDPDNLFRVNQNIPPLAAETP